MEYGRRKVKTRLAASTQLYADMIMAAAVWCELCSELSAV